MHACLLFESTLPVCLPGVALYSNLARGWCVAQVNSDHTAPGKAMPVLVSYNASLSHMVSHNEPLSQLVRLSCDAMYHFFNCCVYLGTLHLLVGSKLFPLFRYVAMSHAILCVFPS